MKSLIFVGLAWLLTTASAQAFVVVPVEPAAPYEPFVLTDSIATKQLYVGTLDDFPDMFEVSSDQPFTLTVALATLPEPAPLPQLSVIVVAVDETGVAEVARLPFADSDWLPERQPATGLLQRTGMGYETELEPGTYRIEISSPENTGKYILQLGNQSDDAGYFAALRSVGLMYEFYGANKLGMIRSPYVHYPLGIVILLGLFYATYRWRKSA